MYIEMHRIAPLCARGVPQQCVGSEKNTSRHVVCKVLQVLIILCHDGEHILATPWPRALQGTWLEVVNEGGQLKPVLLEA